MCVIVINPIDSFWNQMLICLARIWHEGGVTAVTKHAEAISGSEGLCLLVIHEGTPAPLLE
jgi:hypothetical protein